MTLTGRLLMILCSLLILYYGCNLGDFIILFGCLLIMGIAAGELVFAVIAAFALRAVLKRRKPVADLMLDAGHETTTGMNVAFAALPLFDLACRWSEARFVEARLVPYSSGFCEKILASRRCLLDGVRRSIGLRDLFGLVYISCDDQGSEKVLILPERIERRYLAPIEAFFCGDESPLPEGKPQGDRIDVRQYIIGDSSRHILWKIFARNRKLMVRQPERAIAPMRASCAYFVAGDKDDLCASLARTILEEEYLGPLWLFGASGSMETASHTPEALEILARSGNSGPLLFGLDDFLRKAEQQGYRNCLVFVPPADGQWSSFVIRACKRSSIDLLFITALDGKKVDIFERSAFERLVKEEDDSLLDPTPVIEMVEDLGRPFFLFDVAASRMYGNAGRFLSMMEASS